jgi:hypothetical protein
VSERPESRAELYRQAMNEAAYAALGRKVVEEREALRHAIDACSRAPQIVASASSPNGWLTSCLRTARRPTG